VLNSPSSWQTSNTSLKINSIRFSSFPNESRQSAVIGPNPAGQGEEGDVLLAGALEPARADDPAGVTERMTLRRRRGEMGQASDLVIDVEGFEPSVGHPLFDQMGEGIFESAFRQLFSG
jgi:hypothetical protein